MKKITVQNSYDLKISGKPSQSLEKLSSPKSVSVFPSHIAFIEPELLVKEGDSVKIGSPLFFDKQLPKVAFLSPGAGTISHLIYADDGKLDQILITLDDVEEKISALPLPTSAMKSLSREELIERAVASGAWFYLRTFPFNKIANPEEIPPAIYVTVDYDEPYLPFSKVFLKDTIDSLKYGIHLLKKLCGTVHVGAAANNSTVRRQLHGFLTHSIEGGYPANNAGVFMYHNKKDATDHKAWHIHAHDLLLLAQTLEQGYYATERIMVLAGSHAKNRCHLKTRLGAPFSTLLDGYKPPENTRYIAGGVLTGRRARSDSYFGPFETALHLLPEAKEIEFLGVMELGLTKASFSSAFLSRLYPAQALSMTANINGNERACIMCGACPQVCPVDLQPQFLLRDLYAGDVHGALDKGLLDCVECGLCSYVCPSKIELKTLFTITKRSLVQDTSAQ